jgi:hypothetical protein
MGIPTIQYFLLAPFYNLCCIDAEQIGGRSSTSAGNIMNTHSASSGRQQPNK